MYLFKKIVNLGVGRNATVENGEEDSVDNEDESSTSSGSQNRTGSELSNNNNNEKISEVKGGKKKKRKKKKGEEKKDEDSNSSSEKIPNVLDQYYDDLSETTESSDVKTSEENSTSQDLSNDLNDDKKTSSDFWTDVVSETGKEEDLISKKTEDGDGDVWGDGKEKNSDVEEFWAEKEDVKIGIQKDESISDIWADRENDDLPKSIRKDESISDIWADRDSDDVPRKSIDGGIQKDQSLSDIWADRENGDLPKDVVEGQDIRKDESLSDIWRDRDNDDLPKLIIKKEKSPEESSISDFWGDKEEDVPRIDEENDVPQKKESSPDIWADRGNDDIPRKSISIPKDDEEAGEIQKNEKESSPSDIWADREDDVVLKKPEEESQSPKNGKESSPDIWADRDNDDIPRKSISIPKEDEESPKTEPESSSDIWGDREEDIPPVFIKPLAFKPEEPIIPCRKSDDFENFSETESSSKKDSESDDNNKKESVVTSSSEDEKDSSTIPPPPPLPPPPLPLPLEEKIIYRKASVSASSFSDDDSPKNDKSEISERKHSIGENVVPSYNVPEIRKIHQKSFINVIKDVDQPNVRRRSVVLPDSRERTWRESKKESITESLDDDDRSDLDDGPDDSIVNYLGKENDKAEARLLARRQARVEAREIRLRELERQQKEQEENADKVFDMSFAAETTPIRPGRIAPTVLTPRERPMSITNSYHSSRRSSEDSIEEGLSLRDLRHEVKEIEEKFRKAMIANAQLDNEKSALSYQVELLKDKLEDMEESHAQLSKEHRDKCREHEQLKRAAVKLKEDLAFCKYQLDERDRLIAEYGLVIVGGDGEDEESSKRTLVSVQSAELLQQAGSGSLDVRLKKFAEERNELLDEVRHLKLELEEERSKRMSDSRSGHGSLSNGPLDEETSKLMSDYKFKLQKAEQDVSTLQANVARLESQVIRYKSAAETSEKAEDELKIEKRKLQRENRESIARIEELETANSHLQRRMDKLKNAKSTLLKEL